MTDKEAKENTAMKGDEFAMYTGRLDYHHTLVTVRFTVLGLHLTATAFLATIALTPGTSVAVVAVTAAFGFLFAGFGLLMDLRTTQLLSNVTTRGRRLEGSAARSGFFYLMEKQDEENGGKPKWPFTKQDLSFNISHDMVLALTYLFSMVFWIVAFVIGLIR